MNAAAKMTEVTCPKCDGTKRIAGFDHVESGRCFRCAGNGTVLLTQLQAYTINAARVADAAQVAANNDRTAAQNAWLAKLPTDHVSAIKALRPVGAEKLMAIRNTCADINVAERDMPREERTPGARMAYWAASAILNAWPSGTPYRSAWVYEA
jgi:hypothetical protein